MKNLKAYLGDGAYAAWDGYNVIITAEDGIRATDTVYLEPEVLHNFMQFIAMISNKAEQHHETPDTTTHTD